MEKRSNGGGVGRNVRYSVWSGEACRVMKQNVVESEGERRSQERVCDGGEVGSNRR